ncbi:hypothetical protein JIQ42_04029 [Leishmania sp. Namibia]|uniref:hypothetical protein n=1 Tax=Leishmania sp. Namibia TaxID=2802991 RepID=UPI001B460A6F|nr:hypothetical protein JIQ42_04029 [Leishmania sp. Namibia]
MQVAFQESIVTGGISRHRPEQAAHRDGHSTAENSTHAEICWNDDGDGGIKSASLTNSSAVPQQATVASSLLFQYFSLLASYHGAVHVPRFWVDLLLPSSVAEFDNDDLGTVQLDEDGANGLISPVTEVDLSACYVGPTTLLALADLLRVHRVPLQRSRGRLQFVPGQKRTATLPSVMAPFWCAGPRRAATDEDVMCSLLPHLETLRLSHLAMDFTSPYDTTTLRGGSAVLRHMLEALQGHPSIKLLDISGNPVAAALVPAVSRLLQTTPSLTTLVLGDTLISESEREMLRAQCLLNELRLQRAATDGAVAAACDGALSSTSPALAARALWVGQMRQRVFMAVERGASAVPWLLGRSTALIRCLDVPLSSHVNTSAFERSSRGSRAPHDSCNLFEFDSSFVNMISAADEESSKEVAYVSYDFTADGTAAAAATVPPPAGATWSTECVDVVRCAFMPRSLAQRTVLGERPVWPNVPEPLERMESRDLVPPSASAVAATDLMLCLRKLVLPDPEAPPGLRRRSALDAAFLTTSEENFWAVQKKQDAQWGYVLQKVSEHLVPVSVSDGQTLYVEGSECDYIYLLPVSLQETRTRAELHAGVNPRRVNQVLPGQWVGDAEVLDCVSVYAQYQSSAAGSSSPVPVSMSAFQRSSTVRIATEATGDVVLWALPFPVAFFYLYAPYQLLHKQFIHRTPMSAFVHIHPVHLACVPVHLHASHGSLQAVSGQDDEPAPVLCGYALMSSHVLLLEEGKFLLRLPTRVPCCGPCGGVRTVATTAVVMEDHHLLSGVTVLTQPILDLDAALRADAAVKGAAEMNGASVPYARGPQGTVALGKEAALCRFRALKTAHRMASNTEGGYSVASGVATEVRDQAGRGDGDGCAVELRPYRAGGPGARWRYAAIANEEFAALCPALRVALTRHNCVVHDLCDTR